MTSRKARSNKPKSGKQTKQQIVVVQPQRPKQQPRKKNAAASDGDGWLRLLADPCGAPFAKPCYSGTDSGYFIRTLNYVPLVGTSTGLVAGSTILASAGLYFAPTNLSGNTGLAYGTTTSANTQYTVAATGLTNFVTNSTVVGGYRCVAACVKWIPTGAYSVRSGVVGSGYSQTTPVGLNAGATTTVTSLTAVGASQYSCSNGSEKHEARWLPQPVDANFTTLTANNTQAAGTVFLALHNIDATASSATNFALNGYCEVTAVWEWIPQETQPMQFSMQAPTKTTMNDVLSRIQNMGRFISHGIRGASSAARLLTAGVNVTQQTRAAMPLLLMN